VTALEIVGQLSHHVGERQLWAVVSFSEVSCSSSLNLTRYLVSLGLEWAQGGVKVVQFELKVEKRFSRTVQLWHGIGVYGTCPQVPPWGNQGVLEAA
jgi:hypothetical protein